MAEQNSQSDVSCKDWLSNLPFVKIFQGFRSAAQPGKLMLAIFGIALIFLIGWILDVLSSARVPVTTGDTTSVISELDAYAENPRIDLNAFRRDARHEIEQQLTLLLMDEPFNKGADAAAKDIRSGQVISEIKKEYTKSFDSAIEILADRFELSCDFIDDQYETNVDVGGDKDEHAKKRDLALDELKAAYRGTFDVLIGGAAAPNLISSRVDQLVRPNLRAQAEAKETDLKKVESDKKQIVITCQLARACRLAQNLEGKGVFATFVDFKLGRLQTAVHALVLDRDFATVKSQVRALLLGGCWLMRFHPVYAFVIIIMCLAIWAVVGGAICRISALHFARDERIGPLQALNFSADKFVSFFSAPLIPVAIIIFICVVMFLVSLVGAVPVIGEIIGGILFPLALVGGFIIALVSVGLMGGYSLMYPTVAVEGSDSFDAISRSFSYIFARPWRMGFYYLVAAVYGAICYLFVHFFAFLLLRAVHSSIKLAINVDGSSLINIRGKLDAIWPAPTLSNLQPDVVWMGLNWSESLAAFLIWIWVALVTAAVLAFVVSFFFSVSTTIYFLLRQRVDGTDLEEVFVEQDVEDLVTESEQSMPPAAVSEEIEAPSPSVAESEDDTDTREKPSTGGDKGKTD
jgi:hypothetical protein